MPLLFENDLLFEDEGGVREITAVNQWACELPTRGVPAANSWHTYVRAVREWKDFAAVHGVGLFGSRDRLKAVLGTYAVHRGSGPLKERFASSMWNQSMSILSQFYDWASDRGYAAHAPFTYKESVQLFEGGATTRRVNQARRRQPKEHVTVKYLMDDFADLFVKGLGRLQPDGSEEWGYRGREIARNSAVGKFVLSSGLRSQEFSYMLACEVPPLPRQRTDVPQVLPVPEGITKGSKFRESWVSYDVLSDLHSYLELERALSVQASSWMPPARWGEPLMVTEFDARGGRVNGTWTTWETMKPVDRRRLVGPGGGSMLLSVWGEGRPFTEWAKVFERNADRLRERYEPRFPHVWPHRIRHTMAMATMKRLVAGYYAQAARLVADTDENAALALYLRTTEPILVLRDLLGHASSLTTEKYLHRLDTTRIFRELYERSGLEAGLLAAARDHELESEFGEDPAGVGV
ncbi:site-specific integrase [Streptomyces sp. NRRL S-646]|uniref:site-specific integrase n=1 Tax=Streptomyces sp. NRRL S-646 TaxID=1463917 RepID=UPI00055F3C61|nr:site-specific integrase [Streptomyces sp. NRRL S-646]